MTVPIRHALKPDAYGRVRAGSLFMCREIGRRTGLTREQATEAWHASIELMWEVLSNGYQLRLGDLAVIYFSELKAHTKRIRTDTVQMDVDVPNNIRIAGKISNRGKVLWRQFHGERWPEDERNNDED